MKKILALVALACYRAYSRSAKQMPASFCSCLIAALMLSITAQAQTHDWENPAVLGINKLPYHATLQLPSKWKDCKEIVTLDGQWKFYWSKDPESRPVDFYCEDYDVSGWDNIKVPGNWQMQGYGFLLSF